MSRHQPRSNNNNNTASDDDDNANKSNSDESNDSHTDNNNNTTEGVNFKLELLGELITNDNNSSNNVLLDRSGKPSRFHGAFTGGFNAGYYNTVGSEKGFQPKQFKSSRTNKPVNNDNNNDSNISTTNKYKQSVHDFMDDEDLQNELQVGKNLTLTNQIFTNPNNNSSSNSDQLFQALQPANQSVALKILKKMGYRQFENVTGKRKSNDNDNKNEPCMDQLNDLFFNHKINIPSNNAQQYGLGYVAPVDSGDNNINSDIVSNIMQDKQHIIDENALSEDEGDIYDSGIVMDNYDIPTKYSNTSKSSKPNSNKSGASKIAINNSAQTNFSGRKLQFTKAQNTQSITINNNIFEPIAVPDSFDGKHRRNNDESVDNLNLQPELKRLIKLYYNDYNQDKIKNQPHRKFTLNERNELFGEAKNTAVISTASNAISEKEKQQISTAFLSHFQQASNSNNNNNNNNNENMDEASLQSRIVSIAEIEWPTAPSKQQRFITFASNEGEYYNKFSNNNNAASNLQQQMEIAEFQSVMDMNRLKRKSRPINDDNNATAKLSELSSASTDMRNAARLKLYGPLTRNVTSFTPTPLLCKRFGVKFVDSATNEAVVKQKQKQINQAKLKIQQQLHSKQAIAATYGNTTENNLLTSLIDSQNNPNPSQYVQAATTSFIRPITNDNGINQNISQPVGYEANYGANYFYIPNIAAPSNQLMHSLFDDSNAILANNNQPIYNSNQLYYQQYYPYYQQQLQLSDATSARQQALQLLSQIKVPTSVPQIAPVETHYPPNQPVNQFPQQINYMQTVPIPNQRHDLRSQPVQINNRKGTSTIYEYNGNRVASESRATFPINAPHSNSNNNTYNNPNNSDKRNNVSVKVDNKLSLKQELLNELQLLERKANTTDSNVITLLDSDSNSESESSSGSTQKKKQSKKHKKKKKKRSKRRSHEINPHTPSYITIE